jgi:hypothetical protein
MFCKIYNRRVVVYPVKKFKREFDKKERFVYDILTEKRKCFIIGFTNYKHTIGLNNMLND